MMEESIRMKGLPRSHEGLSPRSLIESENASARPREESREEEAQRAYQIMSQAMDEARDQEEMDKLAARLTNQHLAQSQDSFVDSANASESPKDKEEATGVTVPLMVPPPQDRKSNMPWYAGPEHCVEWPARSPNSGFLSPDSGLGTQSLREPGSAGYVDLAHAPKSEAEWEALFTYSFDDLAPAARAHAKQQAANATGGGVKNGAAPVVTWRQRFLERVELEKRIFGNKDVHSFMRIAPAFLRNTRFHARWVGPLYAVGTAVTCTDANERIYETIIKDSRARELQTFSSEFKLRVGEANTVAAAEELLGSIVKMVEAFEESKDKEALENAKLLKAICEARLTTLKEDEAAIAGAGTVTDEDDPAFAEEEEDTLKTDEVATFVDPDAPVVVVVPPPVVETVVDEDDDDDDEGDGEATKKLRPAVVKAAPVPQQIEFDPTGMSHEALRKKLERMARPSHVVSTLTVKLGDDRVFPFAILDDPKTEPPAHTVFAHQLDYKGRGPFEQITDATLQGTLWTCSMNATSQATTEWRALTKVRVQIPCSFDGNGQELLVVDHDRAYILSMPRGKATGETYGLRRDGVGQSIQFKISHCHLSSRYVCLVGFRPGNTRPLMLIYNRHKRQCTALQTSIPITSAILSEQEPDTVLLGMKDGTLLRVAIPATPSRKERPNFMLYNPVVDQPSEEAWLKLRKARGDFKIEVAAVPQDHILHMGTPLPISHLVEHGKRLIASTTAGLHLFKLFLPDTDDERRLLMALRNVVSYQWRGNVLVTLAEDNSLRMLQLHEGRLDVNISKPVGLRPPPPDITGDCSAISLSDQAIIIVHSDGSRRVMELRDSVEVVAASAGAQAEEGRTEEEKAKSFLPPPTGEADKTKPPARVQKKRFVRMAK
jgi:hypothetical protein